MKNYNIHLIRHGAMEETYQGRYIGVTDVPLSPAGVKELQEKENRCEYPGVQRLYSSPLKRCLQTAEILYPAFPVNEVENFGEYNFGKYENKIMAELQQDPEYIAWMNGELVPEGAEDSAAFLMRCKQGLADIFMEMMQQRLTSVAVITHGGVIMNLLGAFGIPQRQPYAWLTDSGTGYTISINTALWSRGEVFEVAGKVPFDPMDNTVGKEYNLIDIPDKEE